MAAVITESDMFDRVLHFIDTALPPGVGDGSIRLADAAGGRGVGVFATRPIGKGDAVTYYVGLLAESHQGDVLHRAYKILLTETPGTSYYLDGFVVKQMLMRGTAVPPSALGAMVNSSIEDEGEIAEETNVGWTVAGDDRRNPRRTAALQHTSAPLRGLAHPIRVAALELRATRDIGDGEELKWAYDFARRRPDAPDELQPLKLPRLLAERPPKKAKRIAPAVSCALHLRM